MIAPIKIDGTAVSGAYTGTTGPIHGVLTSIRAKFTTSTTRFVLTINDSEGIPIYSNSFEPAVGEFVEQVNLDVRGTYAVVISGASVDEAFKIRLGVKER